jgi:hypothetical protein
MNKLSVDGEPWAIGLLTAPLQLRCDSCMLNRSKQGDVACVFSLAVKFKPLAACVGLLTQHRALAMNGHVGT